MPYRQSWFDAPKNMSLTVHKELPDGIPEQKLSFGTREAWGTVNGEFKTFHFCRYCGGWIEGHANQYEVNTLNASQLSGRQGTEYHCQRCGERIGFMGMVS